MLGQQGLKVVNKRLFIKRALLASFTSYVAFQYNHSRCHLSKPLHLLLSSIGASIESSKDGLYYYPHRKLYNIENPKKRKRIQRVAVVRPFGVDASKSLHDKFNIWNEFLPCHQSESTISSKTNASSYQNEKQDDDIVIDLFLSFSRTYDDYIDAKISVDDIIHDFEVNKNQTDTWQGCFNGVIPIEARIHPEDDIYIPEEFNKNWKWVSGPNNQFVKTMRDITSGLFGSYDVAFVMESDVIPTRKDWLDKLLQEAEQSEFAILGSKYSGNSWDNFLDILPISLRHHINGNALYNITNPLFLNILNQLEEEDMTPFHATPYDVRISQILLEGMIGIEPPPIPRQILRQWRQSTGKYLVNSNTQKFSRMWKQYGHINGVSMVKESKVISNYAGSKLLPRHIEDEKASLMHGGKIYSPWEKSKFNITLIVSEWHDEMSTQLLSHLDDVKHPFSNALVMVPSDISKQSSFHLSHISSMTPIALQKRDADDFDFCNAPITTDWFMITNAYHDFASHFVDLLFSNRRNGTIAIVPSVPLTQQNCLDFESCYAIHKKSTELFDHQGTETYFVRDFDMIFNTKMRNEFCEYWYENAINTETEIQRRRYFSTSGLISIPYLAFLDNKGVRDEYYELTDMNGWRNVFKRIVSFEEEATAASGETVIANRIMRGLSVVTQQQQFPSIPQQQAPSISPLEISNGVNIHIGVLPTGTRTQPEESSSFRRTMNLSFLLTLSIVFNLFN
mmetsp:Transcript_16549/g.20229  ORF Transcript_16549/g.20229 Transcript_16549/m.20229 type:complete len:735 (+) Transcript_16549:161-2365(+)